MNTLTRAAILTALALAGCTQNGTRGGNRGTTTNTNADPEATRRMITGSHVPQPVDRPPFDNVAANIPVGSAARRPDSLVPSEPTVGAGGQSLYRLNEPSTGAGPEGEPTVQAAANGATPDATPRPARKTTDGPKPKATPTPTPS